MSIIICDRNKRTNFLRKRNTYRKRFKDLVLPNINSDLFLQFLVPLVRFCFQSTIQEGQVFTTEVKRIDVKLAFLILEGQCNV